MKTAIYIEDGVTIGTSLGKKEDLRMPLWAACFFVGLGVGSIFGMWLGIKIERLWPNDSVRKVSASH